MFKHVCIIEKETNEDGSWNYVLSGMVAYDPDRIASDMVLAKITESEPEYAIRIAKNLQGLGMRKDYNTTRMDGFLIYNAPIEMTKEMVDAHIRSKSVMEIHADLEASKVKTDQG